MVVTARQRVLSELGTTIAAGDVAHSLVMPRVAAVACSAGHGTVTRAACLGLGVLAVPQMGDQHLVTQAVLRSGLGTQLNPASLSVEALRATLAELLSVDPARRSTPRRTADPYHAVERSLDLVEALL